MNYRLLSVSIRLLIVGALLIISGHTRGYAQQVPTQEPAHRVADFLYHKAIEYSYTNRTEEAIELLSMAATAQGKQTPELRFQQGKLLASLNNPDAQEQALMLLEPLNKQYPHNKEYFAAFAELLSVADNERLFPAIERYVELNPQDLDMLFPLVSGYIEQGELAKAEKLLKKLNPSQLSPEHTQTYYRSRLEIEYARDNFAAVKNLHLKLLELDPADKGVLTRHIIFLTIQKEHTEADAYLSKLAALYPPRSVEFTRLKLAILQERNDPTPIIATLKEHFASTSVASQEEISTLLLPSLRYVLQNPQATPLFIPLMKQWIELAPSSSELVEGLYYAVESQSGKTVAYQTIRQYTHHKQREISKNAYLFLLTQSKSAADSDTEFNQLAKEAVELFPTELPPFMIYSLVLEQQGKSKQAIDLLIQFYQNPAVTNVEEKSLASLRLAELYHPQTEYNEARHWYQEAYQLTPKNPLVLNNYAFFLFQHQKDLDLALEMAAQAAQLLPEEPNPQDTYGLLLYHHRKNYLMAEIYFRKAVDLATQQKQPKGSYHLHLSAALLQNNRPEEAAKQWQQAKQYPLSPQEQQDAAQLLETIRKALPSFSN